MTDSPINKSGGHCLPVREDARDSEDQQEWGTKENLTKRIKYLLLTLEHFKVRWKKEYLSELREQHRNLKRDEHRSSIHQGDIVTVHNENKTNRLFWNLGRIKSLIFGRDNEIRGANIQLSNGNVIARPLQKLFPLEVTCSEPLVPLQSHDMNNSLRTRPLRTAAVVGAEKRRLIDQYLTGQALKRSMKKELTGTTHKTDTKNKKKCTNKMSLKKK
eukprot:gene11044-19895_t